MSFYITSKQTEEFLNSSPSVVSWNNILIKNIINSWERERHKYVNPSEPKANLVKTVTGRSPSKPTVQTIPIAKPAPKKESVDDPPYKIVPFKGVSDVPKGRILVKGHVPEGYKLVRRIDFTVDKRSVFGGKTLLEGTRTILIYQKSTIEFLAHYYNQNGYLWTRVEGYNITHTLNLIYLKLLDFNREAGIFLSSFMWNAYYKQETDRDTGLVVKAWTVEYKGRRFRFERFNNGSFHGKRRTQILLTGNHKTETEEKYNGLATLNPIDKFDFLKGCIEALGNAKYWNYRELKWKDMMYRGAWIKEDLKKLWDNKLGEFEYE